MGTHHISCFNNNNFYQIKYYVDKYTISVLDSQTIMECTIIFLKCTAVI